MRGFQAGWLDRLICFFFDKPAASQPKHKTKPQCSQNDFSRDPLWPEKKFSSLKNKKNSPPTGIRTHTKIVFPPQHALGACYPHTCCPGPNPPSRARRRYCSPPPTMPFSTPGLRFPKPNHRISSFPTTFHSDDVTTLECLGVGLFDTTSYINGPYNYRCWNGALLSH